MVGKARQGAENTADTDPTATRSRATLPAMEQRTKLEMETCFKGRLGCEPPAPRCLEALASLPENQPLGFNAFLFVADIFKRVLP